MDEQKIGGRFFNFPKKLIQKISEPPTEPVSRSRRFSLDSLRLIPIDKTSQAWTFGHRPKSLEKEKANESMAQALIPVSKYKTLPAIGNIESPELINYESKPGALFDKLFEEVDLESRPISVDEKKKKSKSKLVRTNTYEVFQPIIVDEIDDIEKQPPSGFARSTDITDNIVLIIRLPDGSHICGYFKRSDRIIDLLEYCQRQKGETYKNCTIVVKNEVITELKQTFSMLNLSNGNEVLFLRKV